MVFLDIGSVPQLPDQHYDLVCTPVWYNSQILLKEEGLRVNCPANRQALTVISALFGALVLLPVGRVNSQIISPDSPPAPAAHCGPEIKKSEVLVLDLEPFGSDGDKATEFIDKHVRKLVVESESPETIKTVLRSSRKTRMSAMRRAQTVAAERGCNVVLVLRAWEGETEATFTQVFPYPSGGGGQAIGVGLHHAYATVYFGSGERIKQ